MATALWRRLDTPGHDACALESLALGWRLQGAAVFRQQGAPVWLTYRLTCDSSWNTIEGQVQGWHGDQPVQWAIQHNGQGGWMLNGQAVAGLEACRDLDLCFTPATNFLQIRRIALAISQTADVPVAWLDPAAGTLSLLPQRYQRRSEFTYWYEAPTVGYQGLLELAPTGIVRRYPDLWELVE
ncbi:MAG: putative glycolipid-binding domain-containing protein [Phycisphaeraceae bacterium]